MVTKEEAEDLVSKLLSYIEENASDREGLKKTPKRVIESWNEIFAGYKMDANEILDARFNSEGYDGIVLLKDIEFHSTCEHHLLPFTGKAHIAYIPIEQIVGISKLARLLEVYARRLQNQERITKQTAETLMDILKPLGAAVIVEAKHMCMSCRGAKKSDALMVTSSMKGVFFDKPEARAELLQLIRTE